MSPDPARSDACDPCLRRSWLLAELAGHLDQLRHRTEELLGLGELELIDAVGGRDRDRRLRALSEFEPRAARAAIEAAAQRAVCRHAPSYPRRLDAVNSAAPVLFLRGGIDRLRALDEGDAVAVVGSRRASPYGREVARGLGRGLSAAGVWVISGLAFGADAAAHRGALEAGDGTAAVLAADVGRCYPPAHRALYDAIEGRGLLISGLPPGTAERRWMFPARNRTIAALAAVTVVVEAAARSGSLITARHARELGRTVAAVPGPVTSPLSAGPHGLLAAGAALVRGPEDVLELLFGAAAGERSVQARTAGLEPMHRALLEGLAMGLDAEAAVARAGLPAPDGLAALAWLELEGHVRRELGGAYAVVVQG